jgi:prolyl-tRNA synthetase
LLKSSELLAPRGKTPSKLKDGGVIAMVKAGFAMWNPNAHAVMRLPMGEDMDRRLEDYLVEALASWFPQRIHCPVPEGALAIAVRHIKRSVQLPAFFLQRRGDDLELQGYCLDEEEGASMAISVFRALGIALAEVGLAVRRWDETVRQGTRCRLVHDGEKGDLSLLDGLGCSCGWRGAASSPMEFGGAPVEDEAELARIHTPGVGTIDSLCDFLSLSPEKTVKTMCFSDRDGKGVIALIRGDRSVSLDKLSAAAGADLHPSSDDELRYLLGNLAGYLGPIGLPEGIVLFADRSVEGISWAVVGANERDYHLTGARWGRDFSAPVADIAAMEPGDMCPLCGAPLFEASVTPLATLELWNELADSEPSLTYVDEERKKARPFCWTVRVHMTSLEGAMFDLTSLPGVVSPAEVSIRFEGEENEARAVSIGMKLESEGLSVLLDDERGKNPKGAFPFPWDIFVVNERVELRRPDGETESKDEDGAIEEILKKRPQKNVIGGYKKGPFRL